MQVQKRSIGIIIPMLLSAGIVPLYSQNITVEITNIRSTKGQIIIGIYRNEASFKDDQPSGNKICNKQEISNGKMIIYMSLPPGTYGFALLDDENFDEKMNYALPCIPKEGFGFSNFYLTKLKRPKFDTFSFEVKADTHITIVCRMRYL